MEGTDFMWEPVKNLMCGDNSDVFLCLWRQFELSPELSGDVNHSTQAMK